MELNQVLEARRSIRHYQDQPVDLTLIGTDDRSSDSFSKLEKQPDCTLSRCFISRNVKKNQNGLSAGFQSEKLSGRLPVLTLHLCEKPCRLRKRRSAIQ